jgi:hypothetical protein
MIFSGTSAWCSLGQGHAISGQAFGWQAWLAEVAYSLG